MSEKEALLFDYVDLNEIDPSFAPIPEDMYTLNILKAEKKDFEYKKGDKIGQQGQLLKFQLAVAEHPELSGRRLFESLFPSSFVFRVLRRVADVTGVTQEVGSPLESWLEQLSEVQPSFKVMVEYKKDRAGVVILNEAGKPAENAVNWKTVQPA
jgi:hypothetical protein